MSASRSAAAGRAADHVGGPAHHVVFLIAREIARDLVVIAMTGDLVTIGDDRLDGFRITLGDAAAGDERRLDAFLLENAQNAPHRQCAARTRTGCIPRDPSGHSAAGRTSSPPWKSKVSVTATRLLLGQKSLSEWYSFNMHSSLRLPARCLFPVTMATGTVRNHLEPETFCKPKPFGNHVASGSGNIPPLGSASW